MESKTGTILDAYIPMDRRQALASGQSLPATEMGTVLFADISGFTQLTSHLAKEFGDQRGADEITSYLNLIYDALITRIHQYQGSVISFAGDAITCWFGQDPGIRALAAGVSMQAAIRNLVQKHQVTIQIKIVIAAGPAYRYVVGDPKIQLMDLMAGSTILSVISGEKLAKPGDLLVSANIIHRYQSMVSSGKSLTAANGDEFTLVTALKEEVIPTPWQEESRLPPEILAQWLLTPVYEKIRHGEERFLAELRTTISLFLKFEGINFDKDPDSGLKINGFISWVQNCLARHDGHLLQVIIGDKGNYLYIGFGALTAHEDDPARAIAAALVLRQPPDDLSFVTGIQVGIALGRMLAGPYGSPSRRTYSMLGANANLAARLMERAAPRQILLTERVALAAQEHFLFDPLGLLRFKGIDQAIPVFALIGARNVARHIQLFQTPLVGRTEELAQVLRYAGQINHSKPTGMLLLLGEGGIGKTRLLSEFMRQILEQDITVLTGFGYAIENSTPYFVVRELFRQAFNSDQYTAAGLQKSMSIMVRDINPEWERLLPLLSEILPLDLPDNDLTVQMSGDIRSGNLHTLLIGIFRKISHQSAFLLIIDDAHWIDSASWAFIKELKMAIPQVGLIISSRPFTEDPPKDYLRLTGAVSCIRLPLSNLDRADVGTLVCQVAGAADLQPDVLSLVYEKTSGHPYFSEELAYALVASGLLVIRDGHCRLVRDMQDLKEVAVPDTIQSAVTSRLDRMTLQQQLTLKAASILGRLFVIRAVQGIHPTPPELPVLRQQIEAMTGMNLISLQVVDPELAYSFKQNIIHDVAYNMLSFNQRHELHQKAAYWYENAYAADLSPYYSHLGYHWQQAEGYDKAAVYLEMAAFEAMGKGAYRDGILYIEKTLALATKTRIPARRKAVLLLEMGIAYFKTGELEQATKMLQTGLRTIRHPAPSSGMALVFNLLVQVIRQVVYRLRSRGPSSPAEADRKLRLTISRAYEYLAQSYFHHNKLFFSLDAGLSGLNAAESAGPSAQLARAYASLCITSSTMPVPGLAELYARLAESLLSDDLRLDDHGRVLELIAVAWSGRGRWEDIEQLCSTALGMANEIGDRFLMMENTCILAACLLPQGKLAESARLREELYQIGLQDKVELVQGWALLQLAEVSLIHRDFPKTHDLLVEASGVEHALGQPDRLWLHGLHAAAYTHLGDLLAAHESARHALTLARQTLPTSFFVLEGYSGMMLTYLALRAAQPKNRVIRKQAGQALKAFAKYAGSFPIGQPRLLYWRGKSALQDGHAKKAIRLWRAGSSRAKELRMVREIALFNEDPAPQLYGQARR